MSIGAPPLLASQWAGEHASGSATGNVPSKVRAFFPNSDHVSCPRTLSPALELLMITQRPFFRFPLLLVHLSSRSSIRSFPPAIIIATCHERPPLRPGRSPAFLVPTSTSRLFQLRRWHVRLTFVLSFHQSFSLLIPARNTLVVQKWILRIWTIVRHVDFTWEWIRRRCVRLWFIILTHTHLVSFRFAHGWQ